MAALNNRSRGGEIAASSYPNTRSRVSKVDSTSATQNVSDASTNTSATNDTGNQPTATSNEGGTSNTVGVTRNGDDNVANATTSVIPLEVGDDSGSDNNSPVDTTSRRFRFGRVTEDGEDDSDQGEGDLSGNIQTGDGTKNSISGTSPDNVIPLLS